MFNFKLNIVQKIKNKITQRYTLFGILAGIIFRIISIIVTIINNDMPLLFSSIVEIHIENSNNYFFDIFPVVVMGLIGYFLGKSVSRITKLYENLIDKDKNIFDNILDYIEKLRKGETDFKDSFRNKDDELVKALNNLRNELELSRIEEGIRKKEDEQRNWVSEGLAEFGAILRDTSDNLDELSNRIISKLVTYIDAKQAGFFIIEDSDKKNKYIKQIASFAYDRKKFTQKKIEWGEGLIGACILEKETIFLDKVTDSYVEITSGLGKANPSCILIIPLKTEDGKVLGAIELASFKIYKNFEINFVERVAESIASTITTLKINMQTENLLKDSRLQARELTKQEEKMRRNVEEMQELQLEASKQSEEFVSFTNSVNHTMIRAEYSKTGILIYANTKFLSILGFESNSEVEGRHITDFINQKDHIWFNNIWERLISGGKHFEGDMKHVAKNNKEVWTISTYVSVRDFEGNPEKILYLGIDTTEAKKQSLDFEGQINALNHSSLKAEFSPSGNIIEFNKKYLDAIEYEQEEIEGKTVFDFIKNEEKDRFIDIWNKIKKGIPFEGRILNLSKSKKEVWIYGAYSIAKDMYDDIAKIIFIGNNITEQHIIEQKNIEQTVQLKRQEEKLKQAKTHLSKKLQQSREEMKSQFREIETVKLLHEKTLEGMLDAIVTINQDNKIEFFNKAAEELWGIEKDDILNKDIFELLPKEHSKNGDEYLGEYFRTDKDNIPINTRKEVYIMNNENEQTYVLMTLSEAGLGLRYRLTAFIQRIEIEFF